MDFSHFLDWQIAMDDKNSGPSLDYFMRILDMKEGGFLDKAAMRYYLTGVMRVMTRMGCNTVPPEDVIDEIYDMVTPRHPERITVTDLIKSGYGDVVLHMLGEAHSFYCYDNREALKAEETARKEQEEAAREASSKNQAQKASSVSNSPPRFPDSPEGDDDADGMYNF